MRKISLCGNAVDHHDDWWWNEEAQSTAGSLRQPKKEKRYARSLARFLEVRAVARKVSDRLEDILTKPISSDELNTMNELIDRLAVWVHTKEYEAALKLER